MNDNPGTIITFYSYKGGTGRSMAVANIGCLLGKRLSATRQRVLIVDWDLEAPGLHRFFFSENSASSLNRPGLINYFDELVRILRADPSRYSHLTSNASINALEEILSIDPYLIRNVAEGVDLFKAGHFDSNYPALVNSFDWVRLHKEFPRALDAFRDLLSANYTYSLIDSRTGFSDLSSIPAILLPEKLVVVFTPNSQSVVGALNLVETAINYRRASNDFRPLSVFPLPSRIDLAERELREEWRRRCQDFFEDLFRRAYALTECDLTSYFDDVQLPHVSYYSFGERVAVLEERSESLSLRRAYETFFYRLIDLEYAWQQPKVIDEQVLARPQPIQRPELTSAFDTTVTLLQSGKSETVILQFDQLEKKFKQIWTEFLRTTPAPSKAPAAGHSLIDKTSEAAGVTLGIVRLDGERLFRPWKRLLEAMLRTTKGVQGHQAITSLPDVACGFLYMAACVSALHWESWKIFKKLLWEKFEWDYMSGRALFDFGFDMSYFFHPEALGRDGPKTHDLYRAVLSEPDYLNILGGDEEELFDLYVQTQMLHCLRSAQQVEQGYESRIWADFGRFREHGVIRLLDRVYHDPTFAQGLASTFDETADAWKGKLNTRLSYVRNNYFTGAPYFWSSIDQDYAPRQPRG